MIKIMQKQRFFELKMSKTTVVLYESELISLLQRDPDLWAEGVRRGKAFLRARTARTQESKPPHRCKEVVNRP